MDDGERRLTGRCSRRSPTVGRCAASLWRPRLNASTLAELADHSCGPHMIPRTRNEAVQLLADVGAPPRLRRHAELVGEAAETLLLGFRKLGVPLEAEFVRVGVVLHDVGKSLHPSELDAPGAAHEPAGERLLLERGVSAEVARVCRSHAQWRDVAETLEELVIALADKLWKGARVVELEELVIERASAAAGRNRWDLFTELDAMFERVASEADSRLGRSVV